MRIIKALWKGMLKSATHCDPFKKRNEEQFRLLIHALSRAERRRRQRRNEE